MWRRTVWCRKHLLMLDSSSAKPWPLRLPLALLIFAALVLMSGCGLFGASKKVQVPQLLSPLAEANKSQLFGEINRLSALQSIHGRVDIQFEDTSFADAGIAEKYKQADGTVTLQRPGKVYLIVQVPFIAKDIAQMTSDGEHFRVAVLQGDDKYRRFVKGTNSAVYDKLELNGSSASDKQDKKKMGEKEAVSALSNLRPQHLTDALMLGPIDTSGQHFYSQSEFYLEEDDTRVRAKKGIRVVRGYYLLEELTQPNSIDTRLRRRFWFDRVGGIRLARLQTFDERGLLTTDIAYRDEKPFGDAGQIRLPTIVEITRPHDRYKLSITYQAPASVELNREYRPEAFVLENRWQLPEVDLDARQTKRVTSNQ
jgi:hypothetical protein